MKLEQPIQEKIAEILNHAIDQINALLQQDKPTAREMAVLQSEAMLVLREIPGFIEKWAEFKKYRKDINEKMTPRAEINILNKLYGFHKRNLEVLEIMDQTIKSANNWVGVFEIKPDKKETKFQTVPTPEFSKPLKLEYKEPPKVEPDATIPTIEEMIQDDIEKMKAGNGFVPKAAGMKFEKLWKTKKWRPTKSEVEKFDTEACDQFIRELKGDSTKINNRAAANHLEKTREFTDEHKARIGVIAETLCYLHYLQIESKK